MDTTVLAAVYGLPGQYSPNRGYVRRGCMGCMLSVHQALASRGESGQALPTVWQGLTQYGIVLRQSQLVLVAAGPGTGKSAFVLNYALKAGVPCLYFSADSDAYTQSIRSIAIMANQRIVDVEQNLGEYDVEFFKGMRCLFNFNPNPTLDYIEEQVRCYEELYGHYPTLIVIDNLMDVSINQYEDSQSRSLDELTSWLHSLARQSEACVIALHHVTSGFNNADQPIPLSGVKGQVTRVPEMVLTLHKPSIDVLAVSPVKNRGAFASPSAKQSAWLSFDGDRLSVADFETNTNQGENPYG